MPVHLRCLAEKGLPGDLGHACWVGSCRKEEGGGAGGWILHVRACQGAESLPDTGVWEDITLTQSMVQAHAFTEQDHGMLGV